MERRRFTREFKLEAVRLIRDRGGSYAQAAQDLKVHPTQLRNWVKALADDVQDASGSSRTGWRHSSFPPIRISWPKSATSSASTSRHHSMRLSFAWTRSPRYRR